MRPIRPRLTALLVALGSAAFLCALLTSAAAGQDRLQPQRRYHDPASTGPAESGDLVIGLALTGEPPVGEEWVRGAALAVSAANQTIAPGGPQFSLLVKRAEPRWASAAETYRDLIFLKRCVGLISPASGEVGHLAAQMASKGHTPLVCLSPESSLTRIPVAWLFRTVPDARQEIAALLEGVPAGEAVAAIVPEGRDGRELSNDLAAVAAERGVRIEPIVSAGSKPMAQEARELAGGANRILLSWPADSDGSPGRADSAESGIVLIEGDAVRAVRLYDPAAPGLPAAFADAYRAAHGGEPTQAAARGHDAARVLIESARKSDRSGIRQSISTSQLADTITGLAGFDEHGNYQGPLPVHAIQEIQRQRDEETK